MKQEAYNPSSLALDNASEQAQKEIRMAKNKNVSLVLGSGGARGYAHIGVIEELLEQGYTIKSISGSSMGALIGALYACGKLNHFKEWALSLDVFDVVKLVDFSFAKTGLIQGDKVFEVIEKMIGNVLIEDLPIKFTAVATDVMAQKEIWMQKGSLLDAVRASVAIPTALTPKKIDGRYLIDGGVLNPLPIAPTMSDGTDLTIAVKLNALVDRTYSVPLPKKIKEQENGFQKVFGEMSTKAQALFEREYTDSPEEMSMFDIIGRTIDTMQNSLEAYKTAGYSPDIIINIPHNACGFYEFNRGYEMIELGRMIAKERLK
ncbi:MAG: patatin-like phospholipase family protein [Helicobacteraceae bacterium]|nr:patatin-like phospholipase family protein [Helicobacteraceae bacterium]